MSNIEHQELELDMESIKRSLAQEYGDLFADRIIQRIEAGGGEFKFFITNHGEQHECNR